MLALLVTLALAAAPAEKPCSDCHTTAARREAKPAPKPAPKKKAKPKSKPVPHHGFGGMF